jgi:hypothetical protein
MLTRRVPLGTRPRAVRRTLLFSSIALTIGLLSPMTIAAADPPTREVVTLELSGPHFLSDFCGTPIRQEGILHAAVTEFGDGRVQQHIRVDVQLSANGKVAFERPAFTSVVDFEAQTVTNTGTLVNIHAPGEGLLLKEVGRVVRDLTTADILDIAGRWMILDGELDEVCSYFIP